MQPDQFADRIFTDARSYNCWLSTAVSDETLRKLYELTRWGPTSVNGSPLRIVFVRTREAKEALASAMAERNGAKVLEAPVTAILGYDRYFYEFLPQLFPHDHQIATMLASNISMAEETAFRNSSIQGGYFIIAARILGLDVGPMSGFDHEKVNNSFFSDGRFKANFVCCLGSGDPSRNFWDRLPRLPFEDACSFR